MTTLIIEIPDSATDDISNLVKERGGNILNVDSDEDNLSAGEVGL